MQVSVVSEEFQSKANLLAEHVNNKDELGVTGSDVVYFIQALLLEFDADGVTECFVNSCDIIKRAMFKKYLPIVLEKRLQMIDHVLDDVFKEDFINVMYDMLTKH